MARHAQGVPATWSHRVHDAWAQAEGWGLFDVDSTGVHEVQRFDDAEVFLDDAAAWRHVLTTRTDACIALRAHVQKTNPAHWEEMTQAVGQYVDDAADKLVFLPERACARP